MKCDVCGKELSLIFHYAKLNLCDSCYDHINNLKNNSNDKEIINNANTYFSAISEQSKDEKVNFNGISIPLTKEFVNEHPDYYDAFINENELKVKKSTSLEKDQNDNKEDIQQIKESLSNIEQYTRFFYIIGIIGLILGGIGLLFMFFK